MALKIRECLLLMALVVVLQFYTSTATITVTSNFDNYEQIVSKLTSMNDRLTILRAVWGEINYEYPENLDEMKKFYDNLLKYTQGAANSEAEEAAELADVVRSCLVTKNGRLLAETLNEVGSQNINDVKVFRSKLLTNYAPALLNAIFEHAIDAVYPFKRTIDLHTGLDAIDLLPATLNTYMVRVQWNLYLYYKFLQRGDIDDQYIFSAATALRNLKSSNYYSSLPRDTTRRIEAAFGHFPSSLRALLNSTLICLENAYITDYFLYYAESNSPTASSFVPAVVRNRYEMKTGRMVWINSFSSNQPILNGQLTLKAQSNGWLLYRQQANTTIVIQNNDYTVQLRNWVPSLRENTILFEQTGFYMCASKDFDSSLLGFTVKTRSGISLDDSDCHWKITDCSSN